MGRALLLEELFVPKSSQLVLLFAPGSTFKPVKLANLISEDLSSIFSSEPTAVSLPPETPLEVPRVILQQNGVGQLSIGYLRADLALEWKGTSEWQDTVITTSKVLAQCLIEKSDLKVQRMGFVLTNSLSDAITIEDLRSRYIRSQKMEDALELRIAWLRRIKTKDLDINRWVQFLFASYPSGIRNVVIDLNTRPEDELDLRPDAIEEMVKIWLEQVWGDIHGILEW